MAEKDGAESSKEREKAQPPRRVADRRRLWRLWEADRLEEAAPGRVAFHDDPAAAEAGVPAWYAGVEVHKRVVAAALYGKAGGLRLLGPVLRADTTPAGMEGLENALAPFAPRRFLMETSGVYHLPVYWRLEARFPESSVVAMNASALHGLVGGTRKSDSLDACRLAKAAALDEVLKASHVPTPERAAFRELARYRERRVREVVRQKNRVKKVMSEFGLHWDVNLGSRAQVRLLVGFLKQGGTLGEYAAASGGCGVRQGALEALEPWGGVSLDPWVRGLLLDLLLDLGVLEELAGLAAARLERFGRGLEGTAEALDRLAEFPGLGHVEALGLLAEVGGARRFPDAGRLLVYAGIAPRGGTSGTASLGSAEEKVVVKDRPSARCCRALRRILTRAASVVLRDCTRTRRADDLYAYARAVKRRELPYRKKLFKAAAKVGRKLHAVLTSGRAYDPRAERRLGGRAARARRGGTAARLRQRARKEREARLLAEKRASALEALLVERGVPSEAVRAVLEREGCA